MARSNIETRGELGGVGWGRDPREGREAWRGPLDGKDSTPIGGRAGWRIEERVGFVRSFWRWCARGWEIARKVWDFWWETANFGFGRWLRGSG